MSIDMTGAADYLASNGRLLDRRRFELLVSGGHPDGVLAALDGYRNPDGAATARASSPAASSAS